MVLGDFLRKALMSFFIIVTLVSVVIGVLGLIFEPNRTFGYEAYFSPIIFGLIGVLPSIVTYAQTELTVRQLLFRKVFQLIVLEIMVLAFSYGMGAIKGHMIYSVALAIIVVYLMVHLIMWLLDSKRAQKLTADLKAFQQR